MNFHSRHGRSAIGRCRSRQVRFTTTLLGAVLLMALAPLVAPIAHSDAITIDGVQHTDVLVSVTTTTYYIRFPDKGTILSAPKDTIDALTVTFNKDPYYRDALNERFEAAQKRAAGGGEGDAAGANGLGTSRAALKELLTGIVFAESTGEGADTIVKGATSDGSTSVILAGHASNLAHISFQYTVAEDDPVMQQGVLLQIQRLSRTVADWILPWVEQNGVNLVQTGSIEKTEDGVHASITRSVEGGTVKFAFAVRPEGAEELAALQKRVLAGQPEEPAIEAASPGAENPFGREARRADRQAATDGARPGAGRGPGAGRFSPREGTSVSEAPRRVAQQPPSSTASSQGGDSGAGADFDTSRLSGYQETLTPGGMTEEEARALGEKFGRIFLVLILVLMPLYYIHYAITLQVTAKKTGTDQAWLAWLPIAQLLLMVRIATKPWWWFLLMFVPVVGLIIWILTWIGIAEAREKPGWMGVMTIFPFASFITRTYLAFSE